MPGAEKPRDLSDYWAAVVSRERAAANRPEAVDDAVHRIVEALHPKRIVVFGSYARGAAGPDSDLDLFVEMESHLRPIERGIRVREVLAGVRYPIDVAVYTPAEVADARTRRGNLMTYVDAEGVVLYEWP